MHDAIEDGGGHGGVGQVLAPFVDDAVAGDDDGTAQFVALVHDGLEQLGGGLGDAAREEQVVQDDDLELLPDARPDPETAAFWAGQPEAWAACRTDLETPEHALKRYVAWVRALPGRPVFVAYPAGFDFLFVYWYLRRFAGESPFGHSALDVKTLAMAVLKKPFRESTKRNMPRHWFDPLPHTHVALYDAVDQGALFCNIWEEHCRSTSTFAARG